MFAPEPIQNLILRMLPAEDYQKLAGPWTEGKDPAASNRTGG